MGASRLTTVAQSGGKYLTFTQLRILGNTCSLEVRVQTQSTSWLQLVRNILLSTFKALHDCQYMLSDYLMLVLLTLNDFLSVLNDFLSMFNDFLSLLNVCML